MTVFFSQLINGLSLGSIYALIALGYSMVYGIILLLNFAHGDVIMVGAYMSWFVMNQLGWRIPYQIMWELFLLIRQRIFLNR